MDGVFLSPCTYAKFPQPHLALRYVGCNELSILQSLFKDHPLFLDSNATLFNTKSHHSIGSSLSDFEDSRWRKERYKFNGMLSLLTTDNFITLHFNTNNLTLLSVVVNIAYMIFVLHFDLDEKEALIALTTHFETGGDGFLYSRPNC